MLAILGWYTEMKRETIAFINHLIVAWGGQCTSTFLIGVGGNGAITQKRDRAPWKISALKSDNGKK
ncbi:hypothetical protein VCR1J2_100051 [Vibrio coralliirubri]|nr:hypothetical protein VCR1J2_100051 [Vibrio coralliirubri]